MCFLLEYFNGALYINVWASIIQTIHLSEHFYTFRDSDNRGSTAVYAKTKHANYSITKHVMMVLIVQHVIACRCTFCHGNHFQQFITCENTFVNLMHDSCMY